MGKRYSNYGGPYAGYYQITEGGILIESGCDLTKLAYDLHKQLFLGKKLKIQIVDDKTSLDKYLRFEFESA